jgi:hypothetical protein
MRDDLRRLTAERYPAIAANLLSPLLQLLMVSRGRCGGDIDRFLIMLVVGVRTAQHPDFAKCDPEQLFSGDMPVFPSLGINARSIADSIGAPRESIRRKVGELIDQGWLFRQGNRLYFTAQAYRALAPVQEQIENLAILNYETIKALLDGVPAPSDAA